MERKLENFDFLQVIFFLYVKFFLYMLQRNQNHLTLLRKNPNSTFHFSIKTLRFRVSFSFFWSFFHFSLFFHFCPGNAQGLGLFYLITLKLINVARNSRSPPMLGGIFIYQTREIQRKFEKIHFSYFFKFTLNFSL